MNTIERWSVGATWAPAELLEHGAKVVQDARVSSDRAPRRVHRLIIAVLAIAAAAVLITSAFVAAPAQAAPATACRASATRIEVTPAPGGGSAGHDDYRLTVTNTGTASCVLRGHAGVAMVTGDDGRQVGATASWTGGTPTVVVAPGRSATTTLRITDAEVYGTACHRTAIRGFRVDLPDQTAAQFAPQTGPAGCANPKIGLLQLQPF